MKFYNTKVAGKDGMSKKQKKPSVRQLAKSVKELRKELLKQWELNHGEQCGNRYEKWPHPGTCYYPQPEILQTPH